MSLADRLIDGPGADDPWDNDLPRMSFLQHLEELRNRLIISIIALILGFLACWTFAPTIFRLIEQPILQYLPGQKLAFTEITSPFFLYMKVAFFAGMFAASPLILLQLWLFIAPGLYPRERRYAVPFIFFATAFFLAGGYFGYRIMLPMACRFFVGVGGDFHQVITINDYFSFASKLVLAMAVVFETPILIFFLSRLGIVTPAFLLAKFKYVVVIIFIIAAIITPPDVVTQSVVAIPMCLLYLIGVAVSWIFAPKKSA